MFVVVGLNKLGIYHINLILLPIMCLCCLKLGVSSSFSLISTNSVKIRVFWAIGRTIVSGDGIIPLSQYPPIREGTNRTLGPAFSIVLASISCLKDSRLDAINIKKIENRNEYIRVNNVAIIMIKNMGAPMPSAIVNSKIRSLE